MADIRTPKWRQEVAYRAALGVIALARRYRVLDARLNGALDALETDVDEMRAAISATSSSRAARKSATAGQRDATRRGWRQVRAFRRAMRLAHPRDRALHRRFGIGERINEKKVGSVAAALQMVLDAAAQEAEAVREAGVVAEDLEALKATLLALLSADSSQETRKVDAKGATARRGEVQLKIEAAIGKVLAAAAVVFRDRPEVAAEFEAIVPGHGPRRVEAPKVEAASPA